MNFSHKSRRVMKLVSVESVGMDHRKFRDEILVSVKDEALAIHRLLHEATGIIRKVKEWYCFRLQSTDDSLWIHFDFAIRSRPDLIEASTDDIEESMTTQLIESELPATLWHHFCHVKMTSNLKTKSRLREILLQLSTERYN